MEVELNELRIGNYVIENSWGRGIIKLDAREFYNMIGTGNSYSSVPLTSEILERCEGYKILGDLINTDDGYQFENDEGQYLTDYPIKYLHQLQNLYFAITGKELQVNLNSEQTVSNNHF